jgi:hypothetical protein
MPWKIVNLDYACDRPHLHMKDPNSPIHLRSYFDDEEVEIALGAEDPDDCFVRATVSPDAVVVSATKFEPLHVQILSTILTSLDVEPEERELALAWMKGRMARRETDRGGWLQGNVEAFPERSGWPHDLTDDALRDSIQDPTAMASTRRHALEREAERRGLHVETRPRGPEVVRRPGRER